MLKKAGKPKSNLIFQQKKELLHLKKNKDLAITPFDNNRKKKLVKSAKNEFQNVTMDTHDITVNLERKKQAKSKELKKEGGLDNTTYKEVSPSESVTPAADLAIKAPKPAKEYLARLFTSHMGSP